MREERINEIVEECLEQLPASCLTASVRTHILKAVKTAIMDQTDEVLATLVMFVTTGDINDVAPEVLDGVKALMDVAGEKESQG